MGFERVVGGVDDGGNVEKRVGPVFLGFPQEKTISAEDGISEPYHILEFTSSRSARSPYTVHDSVVKIIDEPFCRISDDPQLDGIEEESLNIENTGVPHLLNEGEKPCSAREKLYIPTLGLEERKILLNPVSLRLFVCQEDDPFQMISFNHVMSFGAQA